MLLDCFLYGQIRHVEIALAVGIVELDRNAYIAAHILAGASVHRGDQPEQKFWRNPFRERVRISKMPLKNINNVHQGSCVADNDMPAAGPGGEAALMWAVATSLTSTMLIQICGTPLL